MKRRASNKVEKVQLVLPPPRRPDTYITKFAGWPQPLARYNRKIIFQLAESAISRDLFADILQRLIRLCPPRRPDTEIAKFARWPQPLGIVSVGTYIKQNNLGIEVEILDGNNVLTLDEVKSRIDADLVGISATAVGYDHAIEVAKVAKERGAKVI